MDKVDLSQLDAQELKKLLAEKEKQERKEREAKRKKYEKERDEMVRYLMTKAKDLNRILSEFKEEVFLRLTSFEEKARNYGDIRSNSKGGFSLRTSDNEMLVRYERNVVNEFDERADMALELIKEFLESTVKKRDQKSYIIISKLLTRNKAGDLNVSRVIQLLDLRNEFNDERWQKAMNLLEESYRDRPISYGVSFYTKNKTTGKDEQLPLNFSAISISLDKDKKEKAVKEL